MAGLFTTQQVSILPTAQQSPGATKLLSAQIQGATRGTDSEQFGNLAGRAIQNIQDQVNTVMNALRSPLPFPNTIAITDAKGNVVGFIGITPDNPNPIWVESIGISGSPTSPYWDFATSGNVFGTLPGGQAITITLATTHPQMLIAGASGENVVVASNDVSATDTSLNNATLTPTALTIHDAAGTSSVVIGTSSIQQTIAGVLTAQLQTISWFDALQIGGSIGSPVVGIDNGGNILITYGTGYVLKLDTTNFIQFLDPTGDFTQLSPTGVLTQNAAGTRFTSISDAGAVSGQSIGTTTFLLNGNSLKVSNLPSASPGAGSKQFWYDPTDSNRVKFAP